jgi:tetratricopeptide (TPR) repeat protein
LTGRLLQRGDDLLVSAELIDVRDNKQLWGDHYQRKVSDLLSVQNDIARDISAKLRPTLAGTNDGRLNKRYSQNAEAYQLYLKGRYFWLKFTPEDHKKATQYFNQAIAIDPTFALAYAGLGDTYGASATNGWIPPREGYLKAKIAVRRALEIDDTLAEAHTTSGALMMFYDLDWAAAEQEYERAIELNPNYAITYEVYSYLLSATGKLDEAIKIAQRGLQADPLSIALSNDVGGAYYLARRYDDSIRQYQKSLELDPTDANVHLNLGSVYELKGMHEEAIRELQKAIEITGRTSAALAWLGHAYATSARQAEALKIVAELNERSKQENISPYDLAVLYVGLGDKDRALEKLGKAYEDRAGWIINLKVEPVFDPLRSDARFGELVSRLKL